MDMACMNDCSGYFDLVFSPPHPSVQRPVQKRPTPSSGRASNVIYLSQYCPFASRVENKPAV
jgi:hypothetical protein